MVYFSSEDSALYDIVRVSHPARYSGTEPTPLYNIVRVSHPARYSATEPAPLYDIVSVNIRPYFSLNEDITPQIPQPLVVNFTGAGYSASAIGSHSLVETFIDLYPAVYSRRGGEGHVDSSINLNESLPFTSTSAWTRANLGSMTLTSTPEGLLVRGSQGGTLTFTSQERYTSFDADILTSIPSGPHRLRFEALTPSGTSYVEIEQTASGYFGRARVEEGTSVASFTRKLGGFSRLRLLKDDDRVTAMVGNEVLLKSIQAPTGRSTLRLTLALPENLARPFSVRLDSAALRSGLRLDDILYPGITFSDRTFRVDVPPGETSASIIIYGPWGRTERPDYVIYNRFAPFPYVGGATRGI